MDFLIYLFLLMLINNLILKIICMIMVGNLTVEADAGDEVSMGDFIMGF